MRLDEMTHDQALTVIATVLEAASGPGLGRRRRHPRRGRRLGRDDAAPRATRTSTPAARRTPPRAATPSRRASSREKAGGSPTELASFDPEFSFFLGGVAAFGDGRRVGAVGVSGLAGEVDEQLAFAGDPRRRARRPGLGSISGADDERPQALALGREVEAERQQHERVDEDQADRER